MMANKPRLPITPVILAAGNSTRFGQNKLLYPVNGKPMVHHVVDQILQLQPLLAPPVLVTQYDEITRTFAHLNVVHNPDSSRGIASSLQLGLAQVPVHHHALFVVADQPYLTAQTLYNFVTAFCESGKTLGCVCRQDRTGNPTIFSSIYRAELCALSGDTGGKAVLKAHFASAFMFPVNPCELQDIDRPDQLS